MTCGGVDRRTATSAKSSPLYTVKSTGKELTVQFTDYLFCSLFYWLVFFGLFVAPLFIGPLGRKQGSL